MSITIGVKYDQNSWSEGMGINPDLLKVGQIYNMEDDWSGWEQIAPRIRRAVGDLESEIFTLLKKEERECDLVRKFLMFFPMEKRDKDFNIELTFSEKDISNMVKILCKEGALAEIITQGGFLDVLNLYVDEGEETVVNEIAEMEGVQDQRKELLNPIVKKIVQKGFLDAAETLKKKYYNPDEFLGVVKDCLKFAVKAGQLDEVIIKQIQSGYFSKRGIENALEAAIELNKVDLLFKMLQALKEEMKGTLSPSPLLRALYTGGVFSEEHLLFLSDYLKLDPNFHQNVLDESLRLAAGEGYARLCERLCDFCSQEGVNSALSRLVYATQNKCDEGIQRVAELLVPRASNVQFLIGELLSKAIHGENKELVKFCLDNNCLSPSTVLFHIGSLAKKDCSSDVLELLLKSHKWGLTYSSLFFYLGDNEITTAIRTILRHTSCTEDDREAFLIELIQKFYPKMRGSEKEDQFYQFLDAVLDVEARGNVIQKARDIAQKFNYHDVVQRFPSPEASSRCVLS